MPLPPSGPERVATAHGEVVLVELGEDVGAALAALPAAEREHAGRLSATRRREFVAGRAALHAAIGDHATPILADDRGAPALPAGWVGSISHKISPHGHPGAVAAAIAAPAGDGWIGVDLERAEPSRVDIARRVLTPRELAQLPEPGRDPERGREVALRFAIKEAIYKAIDPHLRRYVGFTEVELELLGGACRIAHALPLAIEAAWCERGSHWLATARARRLRR